MTDCFFISCFLYYFLSLYRILVYYAFSVKRNILLDVKWTFQIKSHRTGKIWRQIFGFHKRREFLDQLSNFSLLRKELAEYS
jgi:hypothetical protein